MKDMGLIIKTGIKNNIHLKAPLIVYILVTLICVVGITVIFSVITISPETDKQIPDRSVLELFLGLIMYSTCTIGMGVYLNAFAFQSITREKTRGIIESLLATPLKLNTIWAGKSIAIFIPGMLLGEILTVIVMIAVNYIYFIPGIGFLLNPWTAVNSFIIVPFIFLGLSLLSYLVGLTGRPASGNIIVQIFLPVIITLMINLSVHHILEITSWSFAAANMGVAAVIAIIIVCLKHRLTKERMVLSS